MEEERQIEWMKKERESGGREKNDIEGKKNRERKKERGRRRGRGRGGPKNKGKDGDFNGTYHKYVTRLQNNLVSLDCLPQEFGRVLQLSHYHARLFVPRQSNG